MSIDRSCYFKRVVLLALFVGATSLMAAPVIYVNTATGNDGNAGDTPGLPVKTIGQGITNVDAGGTVNVAAGTYNEAVSVAKAVALRGPNAGVSPTTGTRVGEAIITANAPVVSVLAAAGGSAIDGFKFTGSANDVDDGIIRAWNSGGPNDIEIACNIFDGNASRAISVASVIRWNIHDNLAQNITGTQESGFYLITMQQSVVSYNRIANTTYAGILSDSCQDCLFTKNNIQNLPQPGIQVANTVGPNTVSDNTISQTNSSNTADKGAVTIYVNVQNLAVTGNTLTNNFQAIAVRNQAGTLPATVVANYNNISGNSGTAVINSAQGGGVLDATNNWWGNITGPTNAGNPGGTGDSAGANVNFTPWLTGLASVRGWFAY